MPQKATIPRACEQCGTPFLAQRRHVEAGGARFCSRKCIALSQITQVGVTCECCGNAFMVARNRIGKAHFCSRACKGRATESTPTADRFWPKVNKNGPIPARYPELGPCWLWTAGTNDKGYGLIRHSGSSTLAHRVSYEMSIGPIPDDLFVCHHCDNPPCVNPAHFFLGTSADNTADMDAKGRRINGQLHGEANGNSLLTEDQVREIRHRYTPNVVTLSMLAAEYGVDKTTISAIVNHKNWRHVI